VLSRWPTPAQDGISLPAVEVACRFSAWGHRKIWAMLRADGFDVSPSSVARALGRLGMLQPQRSLKERRELHAARRAAFVEAPTRRNRIWQVDFTCYQTEAGGFWQICPVVDYATKTVLAAPVTSRAAGRDAVAAVESAIARATELLGFDLLEDCVDLETGELFPVRIVTDNGAAFKSTQFARLIASRPHLEHIRTRHYAPQTNGVVERFNRTLKYEHLYREEIAFPDELARQVDLFVGLYNEVRPHEALGFCVPLDMYRGG
jgi:putative transposase